MTDSDIDKLHELEEECAAQRKTIAVLMGAVEHQQSSTQGGSYQVFQQTLALERAVAAKTVAFEATVLELGKTQGLLLHAQKLEAVGQLAAGVAHEINTPMQYIGDNTRFLKKAFDKIMILIDAFEQANSECHAGGVSDAAMERVAQAMKSAKLEFLRRRIPRAIDQSIEGVETVSRIISAMKEFSHPGTEEKVPTDLNHLLETTKTVCRNEWKYVADVVLELDSELPFVPAYGSELNQVFLNLIVNAAHAIEESRDDEFAKGTITISTGTHDDRAEIVITDTGGGIPEAIRDRIFDPFFTTKEVGKGTGQGLAIAHAIVVDKHAGSITVSSNLGVGSTFRIRLPLTEAGAP